MEREEGVRIEGKGNVRERGWRNKKVRRGEGGGELKRE